MTRFQSLSLAAGLYLVCAPACDSPQPETDEVLLADVDGKFDRTSELRVRTSGTTLWVNKTIARAVRGEQTGFVVAGRTSRNLTDGNAFVVDDPYGAFAKTGPRRFEVFFADSEAASMLVGVNLFTGLSFPPSGTLPTSLTSRTVARVKLGTFAGSGISLRADVIPVVNAGLTVWRIQGSTTNKMYDIALRVGDRPLGTVRQIDDTHFQVDLSVSEVVAHAGSGLDLTFAASVVGGGAVKTARLGLAVSALGLTAGDAYEVWPSPVCDEETKACLTSLPDGTLDLGVCGEALSVNACHGALGVTVGDVAITEALGRADTLLQATDGFAKDAPALIGADRVVEFSETVRLTIEERLERQLYQWYPSPSSLGAALDAVIAGALDDAYATPLELVTPREITPGDVGHERQLCADALLLHLAQIDLRQTEWGRPLVELVRTFKSQHVESLRGLRETAEAQPYGAGIHLYVGNWLGALVEIQVETATGTIKHVLFEVD
jgi:hypothetical protein